MSRSLILAFMIALLVHFLLAGVELDLFKPPFHRDRMPKTLTVDLIKPVKEKASFKVLKPPVRVEKAKKKVKKKDLTTKKPKTTPEPTPKQIERKKKDPVEIPEKPPPYLPSESPWETEEKTSPEIPETEYAFVPDMADIPTTQQQAGDEIQSEDEDRPPPGSRKEPITLATPDYKINHPPTYPLLAKRRRYEGTVLLDVLVSPRGIVDSVELAQSSGHQILDRAAVKAVRKWIFHPGKKGDEAREMWVTVPIRFQLQ